MVKISSVSTASGREKTGETAAVVAAVERHDMMRFPLRALLHTTYQCSMTHLVALCNSQKNGLARTLQQPPIKPGSTNLILGELLSQVASRRGDGRHLQVGLIDKMNMDRSNRFVIPLRLILRHQSHRIALRADPGRPLLDGINELSASRGIEW